MKQINKRNLYKINQQHKPKNEGLKVGDYVERIAGFRSEGMPIYRITEISIGSGEPNALCSLVNTTKGVKNFHLKNLRMISLDDVVKNEDRWGK